MTPKLKTSIFSKLTEAIANYKSDAINQQYLEFSKLEIQFIMELMKTMEEMGEEDKEEINNTNVVNYIIPNNFHEKFYQELTEQGREKVQLFFEDLILQAGAKKGIFRFTFIIPVIKNVNPVIQIDYAAEWDM